MSTDRTPLDAKIRRLCVAKYDGVPQPGDLPSELVIWTAETDCVRRIGPTDAEFASVVALEGAPCRSPLPD